MEITKNVPTTIQVDETGWFCGDSCKYGGDYYDGEQHCVQYDQWLGKCYDHGWERVRLEQCIRDFGKGESNEA